MGVSRTDFLSRWHQRLLTRRQLLIHAAGGSLAALLPLPAFTASNHHTDSTVPDPWPVIDAVQQHLFPAEQHAPGAHEINALGYLQFVVSDTTLDQDERAFITHGVKWLQGISQQTYQQSFLKLDTQQAENVLQRIARSDAGENWLSTLMLYLTEALLTDPVYGGNTNQIGWKWLQHTPGFPRPPADKTFPHLLAKK